MENRFLEADKAMSQQIMKEFEGEEWEVDCDTCGGVGNWPTPHNRVRKKRTCKSCKGKGKYMMHC